MSSDKYTSDDKGVSQAQRPGKIHLGFLDGLRGVAALYVVLCHTGQILDWEFTGKTGLPIILNTFVSTFQYGHFAVGVFIVLSGFCLMMPLARSETYKIDDLKGYLLRRARRILPPYYAALVLFWGMNCFVPDFHHSSGTFSDLYIAPFSPGMILSHVFLVHNWNASWAAKIDPPMWSVAVEWQIYFLFPLFLLPLYRSFRALGFFVLLLVVSPLLHFVPNDRLVAPGTIYLSLFSMGILASIVCFSKSQFAAFWRSRLSSAWFPVLTCAFTVFLMVTRRGYFLSRLYITDPLVGIAFSFVLVYFALLVTSRQQTELPLVLRVFQSRLCVGLGAFSYSLYLVHHPILTMLHLVVWKWHWNALSRFAVLIFVGIPLAFIVAYAFHLLVEKPFMVTKHQRREKLERKFADVI